MEHTPRHIEGSLLDGTYGETMKKVLLSILKSNGGLCNVDGGTNLFESH